MPHRVTFCLRDRWSLARRVHVARPRRRRRRNIALTTLPGCSWRVRPSDRIGRKHTTWRPIVSGGNPRGPQGYGKYPACTLSTGEVRPERGKIDGKWEVTSWSPAGIFQAGRGHPRVARGHYHGLAALKPPPSAPPPLYSERQPGTPFRAGSVFPSENHYFSLRKDKEDKDMTKRTRKTRKTRT